MSPPSHNLAIETTTRQGQIALGQDDVLIETRRLPAQGRHNVGLIPGIDELCRDHGLGPGDLAEVYLSLGPGSFTGLRVAIAAAKMLALAGACKLVGVPTLDVIAQDAPRERDRVVACLNHKRETVYCATYQRDAQRMVRIDKPAVRALDTLTGRMSDPNALIGDVPPRRAEPRVEIVWQLGRDMARQRQYTDSFALEPIYGRRPEAVDLWEQRDAKAAT